MNTVIERPLGPSIADLHFQKEMLSRKVRVDQLIDALRVREVKIPESLKIASFVMGGAAAGAWTFTNGSRTRMLNGTFDFDTDTFKIALFLSTSNIGAASTTFVGVTNEHGAANGYSAGGAATTISLSGTTTVTVDTSDVNWTASGGSIVARFAVLYEVGGDVVCYCLLDSAPADVTVTTGNTLTIQIHASGVFTLA